ncbi:hypothetical protein B0H11DRAFT_2124558 [Mycena galericulata]|nr:hypothetical protein B0H11DRAFT_2124558 [Mycena galericulata]
MVFRECSMGGKGCTTVTRRRMVTPSPRPPETPAHPPPSSTLAMRAVHAAGPAQLRQQNSGSPTQRSRRTSPPPFTHADPKTPNADHERALHGFFSGLALCRTVLTSTDPETGAVLAYKAQSPEEAAPDIGYVFRGRECEVVLQTPFPASSAVERYGLLNILGFTSARKQVNVVLRNLGSGDADDGLQDG